MGNKKSRLVKKLLQAAQTKERYRDIHVFFGGTGAVGGTALLQMLSMYEEMISITMLHTKSPLGPEDVPLLLATGKGPDDIRDFTERLRRFVQSRHGVEEIPRQSLTTPDLYLTHSGVLIGVKTFPLTALPGLDQIGNTALAVRREFVRNFLDRLDPAESDFERLLNAIRKARPMGDTLRAYLKNLPLSKVAERFRSVIIGIPIPSLVAYHFDYLKDAAPYVEGLNEEGLKMLVAVFRETLREDLDEIQKQLADTVLLAHTTAIGGMYDEEERDGRPVKTIRLGFSHSAQDDKLIVKQEEAEEFTNQFSKIGINVLITAAAIGIDEVRIREKIPLHREIAKQLWNAPVELFPGSKATKETEASAHKNNSTPSPAPQFIKTYRPVCIPLEDPPSLPLTFEAGETLLPSYSIRSGENGFFSVSNADALYRVMRVASASELGHVMASVGLFGDDTLSPWFPNHVCYYTEGDNSRQVFDLLSHPRLLEMQLSGLEPLALQELGSAKHQGELHTLSLLILLHRLRTLDIDSIASYVDLRHFDAEQFLLQRSSPLTFEDLANWDVDTLAREMQILASAETTDDLAKLKPSRHSGLFENKDEAARRVLERVLQAVQMIPSLGSPILFERDGEAIVKTGYFIAPLALLVTDTDTLDNKLKTEYENHKRERYAKNESLCTFGEYRDFHICTGGFVDLRRNAILCTAKNSDMPLTGKVKSGLDEQALRKELSKLEPYSFFTTCGLVALLLRLRGLYSQLREAMEELGTLHEYRWQMPRDANAHILVVPGAIEAFRMVSEGLEKTTGTERLDGIWGYERRRTPQRWEQIGHLLEPIN